MASSRAPNGGFASLWALITQSFTVYTSLSLLVFLTPARMVHLSPARYSKASLVHSSKRFRRTKRAAFSQPWLYVSVPMSSLSDSSPCSDRRKWLKKWRVCFDWHPGDAAQHGEKAWQLTPLHLVRQQRARNAGARFSFSFLFSLEPQPTEWHHSDVGCVFQPHLI